MKGNSLDKKALSFVLILFGLFPLFPPEAKGLPVIFLIIISFKYLIFNKKKTFDYLGFLGLSSLFIINLLSVLYTMSNYFPTARAETTLSLILVPLSFYLLNIKELNEIGRKILYHIFLLSTGLLSFLSITYFCSQDLFNHQNFKVNSFRRLIVELPFIGDHPIYISMFLGLGILIAISQFKNYKTAQQLLLFIIIVLNTFLIVLLASKAVMIGIVFAVVAYVILNVKKTMLKYGVVTIIIISFIVIINSFPTVERRFRELQIETTYTELRLQNSSSIRLAILKCGIEKIKEKPVLGYGWGLGNKSLLDCYDKKSEHLFNNSYNSHNQFLGYFLDGGILAFLVLIIFLFYQFRFAFKNRDHTFIAILILFVFIMMTENILQRQSGLIPFIFFICFFKFIKEKHV